MPYISTTTNIFSSLWSWLYLFLKNLDPSLFQNVIIGILVIFIPFAIVFLTDILNSRKGKKSEFERMVLNDEVLRTKKVFWFAIGSIAFFTFFSGTNVSIIGKIISIFAVVISIYFFWLPFKNILRFSDGYKPEFEMLFLKKLNFSKILRYRNKIKAEKMILAWNSFWSEKSEFDEIKFTEIFISHIDDAIKFEKYELVSQLAKIYVTNISKRDTSLLVGEILPKVLEWSEKNWEKQNNLNWYYFSGEFFQEIIKISLKNRIDSMYFFLVFKKYIEKSEVKMNEIENKEEKEKYGRYITGLFESFCPIFFSEIKSMPSNYNVWENSFPKEWKISIENKEKRIPRVILHEFLQWSQGRMLKKDYDEVLGVVVKGVFPNIHSSLFTAFLALLFFEEVGDVLDKEPNFYLTGTIVSNIGFAGEVEEVKSEGINNDTQKQEISQKEETIQIILKYFSPWPATYSIHKNDLTVEEFRNFKSFTKEEKQLILKRVRKEKIEKLKKEIGSIKIDENCNDSERKKARKTELLKLVELLLLEIER